MHWAIAGICVSSPPPILFYAVSNLSTNPVWTFAFAVWWNLHDVWQDAVHYRPPLYAIQILPGIGLFAQPVLLFPHLPRSICRTVCTIQKNYVMPQQVSRTKCITGSNIGWECMQDILSTGLMSALKSSNSAMYRLVTSIKSSILHIIIYVWEYAKLTIIYYISKKYMKYIQRNFL